MVRLEEVEDEEILQGQDGPLGGEDDWDTDSGKYTSCAPSVHVLIRHSLSKTAQHLQLPHPPLATTLIPKHFTTAWLHYRTSCRPPNGASWPLPSRRRPRS